MMCHQASYATAEVSSSTFCITSCGSKQCIFLLFSQCLPFKIKSIEFSKKRNKEKVIHHAKIKNVEKKLKCEKHQFNKTKQFPHTRCQCLGMVVKKCSPHGQECRKFFPQIVIKTRIFPAYCANLKYLAMKCLILQLRLS